ncbi:MSMEG_6728 family protein [Streptomyces eurythermus]|uniref:MSMEG_6728 family protein n=1 Tax=Streptomyces eurythermus TaxID=42237 RepID=UPI0033FC7A5B
MKPPVPHRTVTTQAFLPDSDFRRSALLLDRRRLGKQRVEALRALRGLTVPGYGRRRHPAVRMRCGYEEAMVRYGLEICRVWREQGSQDNCATSLVTRRRRHPPRCSRTRPGRSPVGELPSTGATSQRSSGDPETVADPFPGAPTICPAYGLAGSVH